MCKKSLAIALCIAIISCLICGCSRSQLLPPELIVEAAYPIPNPTFKSQSLQIEYRFGNTGNKNVSTLHFESPAPGDLTVVSLHPAKGREFLIKIANGKVTEKELHSSLTMSEAQQIILPSLLLLEDVELKGWSRECSPKQPSNFPRETYTSCKFILDDQELTAILRTEDDDAVFSFSLSSGLFAVRLSLPLWIPRSNRSVRSSRLSEGRRRTGHSWKLSDELTSIAG